MRRTLAEIRQLDAGEGERIPTLAEVLDLVGDKLTINIELKGFSSDIRRLPEAVLESGERFWLARERSSYSSFDPRMLIHLHRVDPDARAGMLLLPGAICSQSNILPIC